MENPKDPMSADDFQKCVDFHGHVCPGLVIGYLAAKAGMERLREKRAEDEELIAIVETDACGADAIQVLTGCTIGKGNFFYKDHGKNVYTLAGRKSGQGVRVALKPGVMELKERHRQLIEKIRDDKATAGEREEFGDLHRQKATDLLKMPLDELFSIETVTPQMPAKARMEPSKRCSSCGEPTMSSKLGNVQGKDLCRDCQGKHQI